MKPGVPVIERAFQLAATARYDNVTQIRRQLHLEGYDTLQVSGPALIRQLMTGNLLRPQSRDDRSPTPWVI